MRKTFIKTGIVRVCCIVILCAFTMFSLVSCKNDNDESAADNDNTTSNNNATSNDSTMGYDNAMSNDSTARSHRIAQKIDEIGPRPVYDIARPEKPMELFPEFLLIDGAVQYEDGFLVLGSTIAEPDELQFYFCNIRDGSISRFNQTLTDELAVYGFELMSDGSLIVAGLPAEKMPDEDYYRVVENVNKIYHLKESGATLLAEIPELFVRMIAVDEQRGQIYVQVMGDPDLVAVYTLSGDLLYEVTPDSRIDGMIFSKQDNKLYVMQTSGSDINVYYLDEANREFREITNLPDRAAVVLYYPSTTYAFFAVQGTVVLGFDSGTGQFDELFDLSRYGISGWIQFLREFENQYIVCAVNSMTNESSIMLLPTTEEHDIPAETLRIGKFEMGRNFMLEELIVNFNFYNPRYFVEIVDYADYGDEAVTRLNLDIISGNAPDMFLLSGMVYGDDQMGVHYFLPIHSYIASGMLVDLAPYMYRDLDFDKYWHSAMEALFIDDASYFAVPSFSLYTFVGRSEAIDAINTGDFNEFLESLRSDFERDAPQFTTDLTQPEFVMEILYTNMEQFVDYSSGNTNFDSEEFIALLEVADLLEPSEIWAYASLARGDSRFTLAQIGYLFDLELFATMLSGDIQTTGFPGHSPGVAMIPTQMIGISAATQNIEGAWAFIREMYEYEDMHNMIGRQIPMNKASFLSERERYITQSSEIIKELYEQGAPAHSIAYTDRDGLERWMSMPPIAVEQVTEIADHAQAMVEQIDRIFIIDIALKNIILEELPAFFNGRRTAADTARVVQSRAQIYVSEVAR